MKAFCCQFCGHTCAYDSWMSQRDSYPAGWVCPYCRGSYSVEVSGVAHVIHAPPVPIDGTSERYSPWAHIRYQPIHVGNYHVRLEALDRQPWLPKTWITAHYNGLYFERDGERLDPELLVAWRGVWL